ncbi:hypothetical protein [Streptomyces griseocarneus]|uniref:hypothetical protein n=1 Tax=Streptomyces griseocarneus TaxID=51201 RepID=UPI00167D7E3F|nr:hypothetical protein [Streptomyces griseocarneus]MBZ6473790.1 hypothetical protein [Streptomyces griseocarneus]GHG65136.1 membrane protein [Streptomyces griseocarneus]
MGIESDQLVYDYLSRVGDLAQRQSLTSGDRMRLVSRLRAEIERRRAAEAADTPAAVQRILDGLGTPAEAVADVDGVLAAAEGAGRVPAQRRDERPAAVARAPWGASPPHLATEEELRPRGGGEPGWWSVGPGPATAGDTVHGFTGGIEIPDMLRPPPPPAPEVPRTEDAQEAREGKPAEETGAESGSDEPRFSFWRSKAGVPMSPLLLLVAVLLVAGAVLGNWIALAVGWALAYVTRRLTQAESKWAAMGIPGLAVTGGVVWLWGRFNGRWGAPIPPGEMAGALADTWPVVVKAAAVASAAFVLWRARRPG